MDLPADKAKLLKNYDNEKKWEMICDQVSYKNKMLNGRNVSVSFIIYIYFFFLIIFIGNGSSQRSSIILFNEITNISRSESFPKS